MHFKSKKSFIRKIVFEMKRRNFLLLLAVLISVSNHLMANPSSLVVREPEFSNNRETSKANKHANIYNEPTLRHIKSTQGMGLQFGISSIGYKGILEWSYLFLTDLQLKICLGGEWKKKETSSYQSIFLQPALSYTVASNDKNLYLNILGGPILAYIQYKENKLNSNQSNFNVGIALGGEVELFLMNNLELLFGGGPVVFLLKDAYNRVDYYLTVGLKVNF